MRRHQEQIRFALLVVRELAARDDRHHLVRLAEDAMRENEQGGGEPSSMAQRTVDRGHTH
jgi:hypothetical protein